MSLHSDRLSWLQANQSLFLLLNAAFLPQKQKIILIVFNLNPRRIEPTIYWTGDDHINIDVSDVSKDMGYYIIRPVLLYRVRQKRWNDIQNCHLNETCSQIVINVSWDTCCEFDSHMWWRELNTTLSYKVCQLFVAGRWYFPGGFLQL